MPRIRKVKSVSRFDFLFLIATSIDCRNAPQYMRHTRIAKLEFRVKLKLWYDY